MTKAFGVTRNMELCTGTGAPNLYMSRHYPASRAARWTALLLSFVSPIVYAAGPTAVSGTISADATWLASASPYVLTGEVKVIGGAHLTIEKGVIVKANSGAGLTVVEGALLAQGTSDEPVVLTSAKAIPASGDWQSLMFLDGTIDADTVLSHVQVRYGHGIVVHASSPTFNDVDASNNIGPAIELDLNASPSGRGLSAGGNDLNGIQVPAGSITGNVSWRLKGIPYVVAAGTLEVGLAPFGLTPAALQVTAGQGGNLTLNIPALAPAGGVVVSLSSNSSMLQVGGTSGNVTVGEGEHTAAVPFTTLASGQGQVTITASAAGYANASSAITLVPPPPLQLTPATSNVGKGRKVPMTVHIASAASTDTDVHLTASNANVEPVPATVTILHGTTSANFEVQGVFAGTGSIQAIADGYAVASVSVTVHTLNLSAPATAFIAPDMSTTLTLSLGNDPAPDGGLTINISSADATIVSAPASVFVAGGASSVEIPIAGLLDSDTAKTLTFSAQDSSYQSATTSVTVQRISARIGTSTQTLILANGTSVSLPVSLSKPAPAGGIVLGVSASLAGILEITPTEVTIAQGQTTAASNVTLHALNVGSTVVVLNATNATGIDGALPVTVSQPPKLFFNQSSIVIGKGFQSTAAATTIYCRTGNFPCDLPYPIDVELSSNAPGQAIVSSPAPFQIPAHASEAAFVIRGVDVTQDDVLISASSLTSGVSSPGQTLGVKVVLPQLSFWGIGGIRAVGEERSAAGISLSIADGQNSSSVSAGLSVSLSVISASPGDVIDGLFDSNAGGLPIASVDVPIETRDASFYAGSPTATGHYQVRASIPGIGTWDSEVQQVVNRYLKFDSGPLTLGLGLTARGVTVSRFDGSGSACPTSGLNVASSDDTKVTVESWQDGCFGGVAIHAIALTNTQPVTLTASLLGYDDATLSISVEPARVRIADLDNLRFLDSARDSFHMEWEGNDPNGNPAVTSAVDQVVDLSISGETPPGMLSSYPIVASNGDALTQLRIPAGGQTSGGAAIEVPLERGHYHVDAQVDGVPVVTSSLQVVGHAGVTATSLGSGGDYTPLGRGLKAPFSVQVTTASGLPPTVDTHVHLVSHAPDLVQVVPAEIVIPAGQTNVQFEAVGLVASPLHVAIDATVEDDGVITDLLSVVVMEPTLVFDMAPVRSVDDAATSIQLAWEVRYRCNEGYATEDGSDECTVQPPQVAAQTQAFTLTPVNSGPMPVLAGFQLEGGQATDQITILQDSNSSDGNAAVLAAPPLRAGEYRIQASLGTEGTWLSDPVFVDVPKLVFSRNDTVVAGLGLIAADEVSISQMVNDQPVSRPFEVSLQVACTAATVCGIDGGVTIAASESSTSVRVIGAGLGSTTIVASAPATSPPTPLTVNVVKPTFWLDTPEQLTRESTGSFSAWLLVPGASTTPVALHPIDVVLESALPGVASVDPAIATIAAGEPGIQGVSIHALRTGATAISIRGTTADQDPASSNVITVVN